MRINMRIKLSFLVASVLTVVFLQTASLAAQEQTRQSYEVEVKVKLSYLLFVPENAESKKLPMILFLHGAGERGDDLNRVKVHGPPKIVETRKDFPFVVVSPQCPSRSWWSPESLVKLVDHIIATQPVDPDRIYLTGLSMGGYGSWELAAKYPEKFAAVAPICGGGDPKTAHRLKTVPIWAFHGAKDSVVSVDKSQRMVDELKKLDADVRFTVYPDKNHDSWTESYNNPELYNWFLSHRRGADRATRRELPEAKPEDLGLSASKLEKIDRTVESLLEKQKLAGAIVLVARNGKVAYHKAFGYQDIKSGKKLERDAILRFYSMSKPIVSVATLMLVEKGKLHLDEPIAKYLPEFKGVKVYKSPEEQAPPSREPTVRDLLRHTSGLTYGIFGSTAVDRMYRRDDVLGSADIKEMVQKLGKLPLLYEPGKRWVYSVSVDVLGRLVEVAAEMPLDRFLAKMIFQPLNMNDTSFSVPKEKIARFATNYGPRPGGGGLRVVDDPKTSKYSKPTTFLSGGGGLVSTSRDYARFCQMLLNRGELQGARILAARTIDEMTKNHLEGSAFPIAFGPAKRAGVGFGLGVSVRVDRNPAQPASPPGEYGWGGAASTHFWVSPKDRLFVIALSQVMPFTNQLEDAIKPIVFDAIDD